MSTDVTDAELAACADVLRRLQPSDLDGDADNMRELRAAGGALPSAGAPPESTARWRRRVPQGAGGLPRRCSASWSGCRSGSTRSTRSGGSIRRRAASTPIREERLARRREQSAASGGRPVVLRIGLSAGDGDEDELAAAATPPSAETSAPPPIGSFRRWRPNTCKVPFDDAHHFYHALCPPCADLNWSKRQQSADMAGKILRRHRRRVRIGYETVLKLLRAGAFVVATTRYPADAALRYSREADFGTWRERLEVCGRCALELRAGRGLLRRAAPSLPAHPRPREQRGADAHARGGRWHVRMAALEEKAAAQLPEAARAMLTAGAASTPWLLRDGGDGGVGDGDGGNGAAAGGGEAGGDGAAATRPSRRSVRRRCRA